MPRTHLGPFLFATAVLSAVLLAVPGTTRAEGDASSAVALYDAPALDLERLRAEDESEAGKQIPPRVGYPMKVDIAPDRFGSWEDLADGSQRWRARVRSKGALWLVLGFGTFQLQEGGILRILGPDGELLRGPYSSANIKPHGQYWTAPIEADDLILELLWPARLKDETPKLHLGTLSHGYRPWGSIGAGAQEEEPGVDAGSCNIDVNCPLGDAWQDEKRGEVMTLVNGSRHCSASLIASTGGECRSYLLTANHCHSTQSQASTVSLMFNFERPACGSGTAPTDQVLEGGATLRATWSGSDFTLLEMNSEIPAAYQAYFNGWSRSPTPGTESWGIHHPSNDEKKISFNEDPLVDGVSQGPNFWRVTQWEQGTTEGGSSGSPLFDQNHRIVGQLYGGTASCSSITWDEYGKVAVSWEGGGSASTRLRDWLDPAGTAAMTLDGVDASVCGTPAPRLEVASHTVDDSSGNGDGIVDPAEPFQLAVDVLNSGTAAASSVTGALSTSTPLVTITDDSATWPDIATGVTTSSNPPHFSLETDASFVCGDPINLDLHLVSAENAEGWIRPIALSTGTAETSTHFDDDMEAGPATWSTETVAGDSGWVQSTTRNRSPSHSWFVDDPVIVSDNRLVMETLPALPANAELRFWHRINAENNWDGAVLEYRQNAGSWVDAGSLVTKGAYNTSLNSSDNPLGGRSAWSGDNGAFEEVVVDLSSLAGSDLQFRWRFGSDASAGDEGWYIDDVTVRSTSYTCSEVILVPGEASDPSGGGAPFTIAKDPAGFALAWSAPPDGATATGYQLYRTPLASPVTASCEADLGSGSSAILSTLSDDRGFLVVARNGNGEGSYGLNSGGTERDQAVGGKLCP